MGVHLFPHPLDRLPRPGCREICRPLIPALPPIRNERKDALCSNPEKSKP